MNGRVTFDNNTVYHDWEERVVPSNFACEALKGNLQSSPLSKIFFSELNINALQTGIKNTILNKSCGKMIIGQQSINELLAIMRAIYYQEIEKVFSYVLPITEQIKRINAKVISYCVPRIMNEVNMHKSYIEKINTLPVPLSHGQSTSIKGDNSLENKIF